MDRDNWAHEEKKATRKAYYGAYRRECGAILAVVREMAIHASSNYGIWRIHGYLSEKRTETDCKYTYRYAVLITVFGLILAEGWLFPENPSGLSDDKMAKIGKIVSYLNGSSETSSSREWSGATQ